MNPSNHTTRLIRIGIYSLVLLFLGILLVLSIRGMVADISINSARTYMEDWSRSDADLSINEWNKASNELERALALNPNQSDYHSLKGLLYEWHVSISPDPALSIQTAIDAYQDSIKLRPAWPDGWLNLARMKAISDQFDEDFFYALGKAFTLGFWEERNQLTLTEVISLAWPIPQSESQIREHVLNHLRFTLYRGNNVQTHIEILNSNNALKDICNMLNYDELDLIAQTACDQETSFRFFLPVE